MSKPPPPKLHPTTNFTSLTVVPAAVSSLPTTGGIKQPTVAQHLKPQRNETLKPSLVTFERRVPF